MEQAEFFQFTIENALEMMIVYEAGGQILYANPAAESMFKYREGLRKQKITDIFPMEEDWIGNPRKSEKKEQELMAYRANRTCFPVKIKIVPSSKRYEEYGEIYLCIAYDITMEKFLEKKVVQVEEEAKEAAKVKTEFIANVTHELRTPVNGILGNVQELMSRETDAKNQKLLQLIERGCRDMHTLINNILDFSKLEAGKFTLECRKFHFRNMIDYIKGNHSNRMTEKGLYFTIAVSDEIPEFIIGDELRIVQILNNLISNGYKFTSAGGVHLEVIKTAQSGKRTELFFMVSDTGIGIAQKQQDKLFKSFSQVDMSIARKYGGTGLGLNICKQLVELMGGTIHVESAPGQGTIFSFYIWVETAEKESAGVYKEETPYESAVPKEQELLQKLRKLTADNADEKLWKYGEAQNKKELQKKMSKLMLCVLMENWEKAEMLSEAVKQLLESAPKEIRSTAFRMKMAVQKEDVQKATEYYEKLQKMMEDINGNME